VLALSLSGPVIPSTPALVAEADETTGEFLRDQLAADGYEARVALSAEHALALAGQSAPMVLLLGDLEPRPASLELLARIRAGFAHPALPSELAVVVLTASRSELDVLRAFEAGADDVVAKPFSYAEVRARLAAVLRRVRGLHASRRLTVEEIEIDTAARSVAVAGTVATLTRREYELLLALALDPARVFTKQELLREVWGFRSAGATRTLDSHACRLRRKLARAGGDYVLNVWGVGYCLSRSGARGSLDGGQSLGSPRRASARRPDLAYPASVT